MCKKKYKSMQAIIFGYFWLSGSFFIVNSKNFISEFQLNIDSSLLDWINYSGVIYQITKISVEIFIT